jgi:diguanylate cyclase (GGDEF)-like protein
MIEASRKPFHLSLQTKVVGLVLLCVFTPLLSVGVYLWKRNEEVLGEKVRGALQNELYRKASDLDDWMGQRLRDASHWAASFVVYEGLESLHRGDGDAARTKGELKQYLESLLDLGRYREYQSLFLVTPSGELVAATREEHLDAWAQDLLKKGGPEAGGVVSPLLWGGEGRARPTLLVLEPVLGRSGTRVGYLVERLDLKELESLLDTPVDAETSLYLQLDVHDIASRLADPTSDASPSFWFLDRDGHVIIAAGKIISRPEEVFPGTLLAPDLVLGKVETTVFPGRGLNLYGLRRLEHTRGGVVAAAVPASAAYKPLEEASKRLQRIGLLTIAVSLLVSFLAARRMLKPILLLSEGARRVSAGDPHVFLPVWGRDEIGDLTRAFNEMTRRVRDGRQNLEEARDELARSNEGLKAANRALETLAITDGLTGLYNHRHFQDTIEKEMRRCEREDKDLSLLLLDLDHFKQYNDRFGHTEGDAALRRVAGIVMKTIRATDVAFRYGGEELAVLLPACSKAQAADVAEKIRAAVSRSINRPGRFGGRLTVSIGVGTFPEDGRVARGLVDYADAALYAAKAQGRDTVSLTGSGSASNRTG